MKKMSAFSIDSKNETLWNRIWLCMKENGLTVSFIFKINMLKLVPKVLRQIPLKSYSTNTTNNSMFIFDRNVKRMQRNHLVTDPNYKDCEYIKSEVGWRVADRVFDIKRSFDNVLDLGCQRGYVSKHLDTVSIIPLLFKN